MLPAREVIMGKALKAGTPKQVSVVITGAMFVALDRAGGTFEFTDVELAEIKARRRGQVISAVVDRSRPGEPIIRLTFEQGTKPTTDPVM
jgi:hypothetical protein